MNQFKVEEIKTAIMALEKFEARIPSISAIDNFMDGIKSLDDYINDHPETPYKDFIKNQKFVYTRVLLKNLKFIDSTDFSNWVQTLAALIKVQDITKEMFELNPKLREDYNIFIAEWKDSAELSILLDEMSNSEDR
jgi:hypothetical protein